LPESASAVQASARLELEGFVEKNGAPERPAWHGALGQIESVVRFAGDRATRQSRIGLAGVLTPPSAVPKLPM
jgi:hypothetical protein